MYVQMFILYFFLFIVVIFALNSDLFSGAFLGVVVGCCICRCDARAVKCGKLALEWATDTSLFLPRGIYTTHRQQVRLTPRRPKLNMRGKPY